MEGTGSILMTSSNHTPEINDDLIRIYQNSIRYLTPREIANLHCFPNNFGKKIKEINKNLF